MERIRAVIAMLSVVLAGVLLVLAAAGCSFPDDYRDQRGRGDAPVADRDDSPKQVINFPDQFSNVAHACDGHGHRVFVTTQNKNGKQMQVVADRTCGSRE